MEVDYLVIAIGRIPQKDFYSPNLKSKENQLINKGVLYLVGDVKNDRCRQISISVGDGVSAAMKIHLVEK
jgi:thioredoxin reductase